MLDVLLSTGGALNSPSAPPVHESENKQKQQGADRRGDNGSDNAGAEVNAQLR